MVVDTEKELSSVIIAVGNSEDVLTNTARNGENLLRERMRIHLILSDYDYLPGASEVPMDNLKQIKIQEAKTQ